MVDSEDCLLVGDWEDLSLAVGNHSFLFLPFGYRLPLFLRFGSGRGSVAHYQQLVAFP